MYEAEEQIKIAGPVLGLIPVQIKSTSTFEPRMQTTTTP
jgi:hypothetical protein